jgi:MFS family permease
MIQKLLAVAEHNRSIALNPIMLDCFLFLLLIAAFVAPRMLTLIKSPALLSILAVLVGAIAGAMLIPLWATLWLQKFQRSLFESQGGGIAYIAIVLPFFVGTGGIAGAWLVAAFYWRGMANSGSGGFPVIAVLCTLGLTVLIPWTIAAIPELPCTQSNSNDRWLALLAIVTGIASPLLGNELARACMNAIAGFSKSA